MQDGDGSPPIQHAMTIRNAPRGAFRRRVASFMEQQLTRSFLSGES